MFINTLKIVDSEDIVESRYGESEASKPSNLKARNNLKLIA